MEPNQAMAVANGTFPPAARLRKSGYRLAEHVLTLTFDFPDAAGKHYADLISALCEETGWQVEITPETNQAALNALVRELQPNGWQIVKGPAIYRDQKSVTISLAPFSFLNGDVDEICDQFFEISGWELDITEGTQQVASISAIPSGEQMEINAAYAHIKSALDGSTLYRTSLKGDEIVLSFISRQVAERYQEQLDVLASQTGWRLAVNPQPNQGSILEVARALLAKAGFTIVKGPSIYLEKAEVSVVLAGSPEAEKMLGVTESFISETGFRLVVPSQTPKVENHPSGKSANFVEIQINRIRLPRSMQTLSLDPAKLEKSIERARRMGISPPIQVRRVTDGYILTDGLFRLRAAEALGLERIPAIIE
jgi:hypothetical protein